MTQGVPEWHKDLPLIRQSLCDCHRLAARKGNVRLGHRARDLSLRALIYAHSLAAYYAVLIPCAPSPQGESKLVPYHCKQVPVRGILTILFAPHPSPAGTPSPQGEGKGWGKGRFFGFASE